MLIGQVKRKNVLFIYRYSAHAAPRDQKRIVGQTLLPITQYASPTLYLAVQKILFANGAIRFG